jgi:hypothetical protein
MQHDPFVVAKSGGSTLILCSSGANIHVDGFIIFHDDGEIDGVLTHLVWRRLFNSKPEFGTVVSRDLVESLHCLRIRVLCKDVECFLYLVVVPVGTKHIDEPKSDWNINHTLPCSGVIVGLLLSCLLVISNIFDEFCNVGVIQ